MKKIVRKLKIFFWSWLILAPDFVNGQGCTDDEDNPVICDPLEVSSITEFLENLVDAITYLSIPAIVIAIIYAGFLFVTAGGDQSQIEDAKQTAKYVFVGAAIILGAELITDILVNTAESVGVDIP